MGPQVLGPFQHSGFDNSIAPGQLLEHLEAIDHIAECGVAAIDQIEASGGEFRRKQEQKEL